MNSKKTATDQALFDISTVSRLTGLSTANIRMWEKRYQAVEPERSESGRRLYSDQDVRRLTLLKSLSEYGHPIRTTANLADRVLEDRLREASVVSDGDGEEADPPADPAKGKCRVIVIGHHLITLLGKEGNGLEGTSTVAAFDDLESAETGALPKSVDLVIVESPALFADTAERVRRLIDLTRALRAVVVYHYAQHQTLEMMEGTLSRITAIRAPVTRGELEVACAADIALANRPRLQTLKPGGRTEVEPASDGIPERNYTDRQIAEISSVSSTIECECPQHMASLLTSLLGFEKYSRECKNRNAADAEIHAYLHQRTAFARSVIEDALQVLVEFEGIKVEQ